MKQRRSEEYEMYELAEYEVLRQSHRENGREVAMERRTKMTREDRETRPYVVRDLSWELARFLEAEDFAASTFAAPDGAHGRRTATTA